MAKYKSAALEITPAQLGSSTKVRIALENAGFEDASALVVGQNQGVRQFTLYNQQFYRVDFIVVGYSYSVASFLFAKDSRNKIRVFDVLPLK